MALSGPQLAKLGSHLQRADCRFVLCDSFLAPNVSAVATGTYTFKDMINMWPRNAWVALNASITIDGTGSQQRDKTAATGHTFTLDFGSGSLVDNADGTCTYTAPAAGSGQATIKLTTDGNSGNNYATVSYGDQRLNIGHITSFTASLSTGCWEMTVRAYGDCGDLDRQVGVLLVVNDYWNGSEDTFGLFKWADGVFFGAVDRYKTIYQDADNAYLELKLIGMKTLLNYGSTPDAFFSSADTSAIYVSDFEAIDAAWIFIQESSMNEQINFWFMDDGQGVANLKLEEGPFSDVIDDILAREFGIVYGNKMSDIFLVGDPVVRHSDQYTTSNEFTFSEASGDSVQITFHTVVGVADPADPTIKQVILEAVDGSLNDLTSKHPAGAQVGKKTTISGLICENQGTLDSWSEAYWWKVNNYFEGDLTWFLMHHVDLCVWLNWGFTVRAADLSDTEVFTPSGDVYVSDISYTVDPGTGLWSGATHVIGRYDLGA
jgi:hypothetical protein